MSRRVNRSGNLVGLYLLACVWPVAPAFGVELVTYPPGVMGFSLGTCCADPTGTACTKAACIVSEMCAESAYGVCAGDSGNADMLVLGSGSTYPPPFAGCDTSAPHLRLESSFNPATRAYTASDALLKWDTSALGAARAVVTGADLQLVTDGLSCSPDTSSVSADDKRLSAEWDNWEQSAGGCDRSDYSFGSAPLAVSGMPIRKTGCYQVIILHLENVENINLTGTTYLRLHLTPDSPPTGTNAFEFSATEELYLAPRLFVKYAAPGSLTSR